MNNNLFLDIGSNLGQGLENFKNIYGDSFDYYLYEPNPYCVNVLYQKYEHLTNVRIFNVAVSNKNTTSTFYFDTDFSLGGSIIQKHNDGYLLENIENINVNTLDILQLLNQLPKQYTKFILKLDVESSEYDILESLMSSNQIFKFSKIYCEFHTQYMKPETKLQYQLREDDILKFIQINNIPFENWS